MSFDVGSHDCINAYTFYGPSDAPNVASREHLRSLRHLTRSAGVSRKLCYCFTLDNRIIKPPVYLYHYPGSNKWERAVICGKAYINSAGDRICAFVFGNLEVLFLLLRISFT